MEDIKKTFKMEQDKVKEKMQQALAVLLDCDIAIVELNENGNQFDYCTDSKLSDLTDKLMSRIKSINSKVYQE